MMQKGTVCRSAPSTAKAASTAPCGWPLVLALLCCSCRFTAPAGAARANQENEGQPHVSVKDLRDVWDRAVLKRAGAAASFQSSNKGGSTPRQPKVHPVDQRVTTKPVAQVASREAYECVRTCTPAGWQEGAAFARAGRQSVDSTYSSSVSTFPRRAPGQRFSRWQAAGSPSSPPAENSPVLLRKLSSPPVRNASVLLRPPSNVDAAPCPRPSSPVQSLSCASVPCADPSPPPTRRLPDGAEFVLGRSRRSIESLISERPPGWLEKVYLFCGELPCDSLRSDGDAPLTQSLMKEGDKAVFRKVTSIPHNSGCTPISDTKLLYHKPLQSPNTEQQPTVETRKEWRARQEQQKSCRRQMSWLVKQIYATIGPRRKPAQRRRAAASEESPSPLGGSLVQNADPTYDDVCESSPTPQKSTAQQISEEHGTKVQQGSGEQKQGATSQMPDATSSKQNSPLQRHAAASEEFSSPLGGSHVRDADPIYDDVCESSHTPQKSAVQQISEQHLSQDQKDTGMQKQRATTRMQVATSPTQNSRLQRRGGAKQKPSSPPGGSLPSHDEPIYDEIV